MPQREKIILWGVSATLLIFVTVIVVNFVRNNFYIVVTVSVALFLTTTLFYSVYVAFTKVKIPSLLLLNDNLPYKQIYKFSTGVRWVALLVLILCVMVASALIYNEASRSFAIVAFVGTPNPIQSGSLSPTPQPSPTSLPVGVPTQVYSTATAEPPEVVVARITAENARFTTLITAIGGIITAIIAAIGVVMSTKNKGNK